MRSNCQIHAWPLILADPPSLHTPLASESCVTAHGPSPWLFPPGLADVLAHTLIPEFLSLCSSEPSWQYLHLPPSICVSEDGLLGRRRKGIWNQNDDTRIRKMEYGEGAMTQKRTWAPQAPTAGSGTLHLVFFFCFLWTIMFKENRDYCKTRKKRITDEHKKIDTVISNPRAHREPVLILIYPFRLLSVPTSQKCFLLWKWDPAVYILAKCMCAR